MPITFKELAIFKAIFFALFLILIEIFEGKIVSLSIPSLCLFSEGSKHDAFPSFDLITITDISFLNFTKCFYASDTIMHYARDVLVWTSALLLE